MTFTSLEFFVFFSIVFFLYWILLKDNRKAQNLLLLFSSYLFYGFWDWRFLSLILVSTVVDYFAGHGILKSKENIHKKLFLLMSIFVNLGILCYFKYSNFFIDNLNHIFVELGRPSQIHSLQVVLPVGISFYTFQTLSYTIDVYRGKLTHQKEFISFAAYVSFFPQLVAGPIERAEHLLPQFLEKRKFDYAIAIDGLKQSLWGVFKKVVIADNCARFVDIVYGNYTNYEGSTLVFGTVLFAFQLYGDFSGYSDIAIGTSKILGFSLRKNFSYPFFSRNLSEFWKRWHISLSSWFRDYVYLPLGGSRGNRFLKARNVIAMFLISGLWHGADWTYIGWGAMNAVILLPRILLNNEINYTGIVASGNKWPTFNELVNMLVTFTLFCITLIIFRSESLADALIFVNRLFTIKLFSLPFFQRRELLFILGLLVSFILVEWHGREEEYPISNFFVSKPLFLRWGLYYVILLFIYFFGGASQQFIYFQF